MSGDAVIREFELEGERYLLIGWQAARPVALANLTPSECEVAMAWIGGVDAKALARERKVSHRTICNQVHAIYRKMGVGSREELLQHLQRNQP